jgi:hypothetical protein
VLIERIQKQREKKFVTKLSCNPLVSESLDFSKR